MSVTPINTKPIEQFLLLVKSADAGRQKEIRLDIESAKTLALTLGIITSRMTGDLEKILFELSKNTESQKVVVNLDPGSNW